MQPFQQRFGKLYPSFLRRPQELAVQCPPVGAHASARVYTMVEMAKAHNLNVEDYLVFLLNARPRADMTDEELEQLAPWSDAARASCAPAFTK